MGNVHTFCKLCVYVRVGVDSVFVCMYVYVHMCMMCVYACVWMCMCVWVCVCVCVCACVYVGVYMLYVCHVASMHHGMWSKK